MEKRRAIADDINTAERSGALRRGDIETMVARAISVVQILPELNAGGVERGTLELADFLVRHGHRSQVISQGGTMVDQLVRQGSTHLRMPYIGEKTPRSLVHWLSLRDLFKNGRIDIVHLRSRLPAWVAYLAWKSLPKHQRPFLITTFHGFYSVNFYSAVMTKGQKVIAISKVIADHIKSNYQTPASKIDLIYRGVDINQFNRDKVSPGRVMALKKKWGAVEQVPVIVLPGRVTYLKGHGVFLDALSKIRQEKWRAICVGAFDPASSYYQSLMLQMDALHLTDVVRFVGNEVDMPAVYAAADIVVSATTAKAEAFGRVAVEAQAMARPIIASAHGGSLETIVHGKTGWLFEPGDAIALSTALAELLSNDELRRKFGKNGLKWAHANFTTEQMCVDTLNLYKRSLNIEQ
jgi:glycosyltransferase involved in cell wall biosynthesis